MFNVMEEEARSMSVEEFERLEQSTEHGKFQTLTSIVSTFFKTQIIHFYLLGILEPLKYFSELICVL